MKRPVPAAKAIHSPKLASDKESIFSVCFSNHFFHDGHLDRIAGGINKTSWIGPEDKPIVSCHGDEDDTCISIGGEKQRDRKGYGET